MKREASGEFRSTPLTPLPYSDVIVSIIFAAAMKKCVPLTVC